MLSSTIKSLTKLNKQSISTTSRRNLATLTTTSTPSTPNTSYLLPTHLDTSPSLETKSLLKKYSSVSLQTYSRPNFILTKGKKLKVWDLEGREFLDFSGGIAVNALGHSDEEISKLLFEQSNKLVHNSNLWHNEWAGELALLLVNSTKNLGGMGYSTSVSESIPSNSAATTTTTTTTTTIEEEKEEVESSGLKVFFSNSGTEANEGALKFARKWGKLYNMQNGMPNNEKVELVSFKDGFHGRSMGALSATWQEKYQAPFEPLVPGFVMGQLNDIEALKTSITEKTCGVIVEPIQGEGGILEADESFLRALRARCDEVGALLIFDEIQCGLGRCGTLWAHSSLPIDCHPDIVTMAKPLANGLPIGAILMKDKVAEVIKIGDHGTTFGGGPLQTRIAHHVLNRIIQPAFLSQVNRTSALLKSRLSLLPKFFPTLVSGPPRGRGLILGIPLLSDSCTGCLTQLARERGVLLLSCGKSTIRFVPSLILEEEDVHHCMDVVESCLTVMSSKICACSSLRK